MYRCCYYTCTSEYFFFYGEIMLFLRYRFKFFTCFPKMQQIILWLWYMNWNNRVCSERRKSHFRGSRFQNFPGEDTPGPPYKCLVLCMHQSAQELDPPLHYVIRISFHINYTCLFLNECTPYIAFCFNKFHLNSFSSRVIALLPYVQYFIH
jgi:hypothetical protein